MSEVAGRMAVQVGAVALQKANGGRGVLLGGVPGVPPGKVCVIGGGVVGTHAARMAMGLGAEVTVSTARCRACASSTRCSAAACTPSARHWTRPRRRCCEADLVVGAVLVPGAAAPKLIRREQLSRMKPGAVIVDVAIDQGGCFETSRATTHAEPTYVVDGIVHYCVANMPGAVPRTSTFALNNATLPFVLALAGQGWREACRVRAEKQAALMPVETVRRPTSVR
jgi:alanine dehydrogenase